MFAAVTLALVATPITIEEAVDLALQRAPEARAAFEEQQASEARQDQASSAYMPRLDLTATYFAKWPKNELKVDEIVSLPSIPGIPSAEIKNPDVDDIHHFQGVFRVGYRAFDLSRGARSDATDHDVLAARARGEEIRSAVAFRTRLTFLAAVFAKEVLALSEQSLDVAKKDEKRAALNAEVGTGPALAVAQARIRVANLEAQAAKAKNELLRHSEQLGLLVGQVGVAVTGDLESLGGELPKTDSTPPSLVRLDETALAAQALGRASRLGIVPNLNLFATAELQYPRGLSVELGPVATLGAQLGWSLWDGGLREAQTEELEHRAEQARQGRQVALEELDRKTVELDARARTARSDLESARKRAAESEVYVRVAKAAVDAGTGTDLEIRTAELALDQANLSLKQAQFELAVVRAERLLSLGRTSEELR